MKFEQTWLRGFRGEVVFENVNRQMDARMDRQRTKNEHYSSSLAYILINLQFPKIECFVNC